MEEKIAIAQLKQGNLDGLEVLAHLYQIKALRAVCWIVKDPHLAEDIVQKAFLRAADRIGQFDDRRSFGPWFLRSVIRDSLKAAGKQKRFISLETGDCPEIDHLTDPTPTPEEQVEIEEISQAVWQAVNQLPPKQKAVVVMRYFLEMSEEDMVEALHGPPGTVKWWLFEARRRLRSLLALPDRANLSPGLDLETLPPQVRETEKKS